MDEKVTVCLTNWMRPQYFERTLDSILIQSVKVDLFLWNNGNSIFERHFDWIVNSSENKKCWPRWVMASFAKTEYVCIIDDDVSLNDEDVLADTLAVAKDTAEDCIVGIEGVNLIPGKTYLDSQHLRLADEAKPNHVSCDIIKGKFMLLKTRSLIRNLALSHIHVCGEDDIAISGILSNGESKKHLCLTSMNDRFILSKLPHALCDQPGHYERRDEACKYYFPLR